MASIEHDPRCRRDSGRTLHHHAEPRIGGAESQERKPVKFDHDATIGGAAFNLKNRTFKVDRLLGKGGPVQVQFSSDVDTIYVKPQG
jgi:hypothetical protein